MGTAVMPRGSNGNEKDEKKPAHELWMVEIVAKLFAQSNQPQTRYPDGMHDGMSFKL